MKILDNGFEKWRSPVNRNVIKTATVLLASLVIAACNKDDTSKPEPQPRANGLVLIENIDHRKGYVVKVRDTKEKIHVPSRVWFDAFMCPKPGDSPKNGCENGEEIELSGRLEDPSVKVGDVVGFSCIVEDPGAYINSYPSDPR